MIDEEATLCDPITEEKLIKVYIFIRVFSSSNHLQNQLIVFVGAGKCTCQQFSHSDGCDRKHKRSHQGQEGEENQHEMALRNH